MPDIYLRSVPSDSDPDDVRLYDPTSADTGTSTALAIQNAAHAHAAGNLTLTQHQVLLVDNAAHAHTADNLTLTIYQSTLLVIQDAIHTHTASNLTITTDGEPPILQTGGSVFVPRRYIPAHPVVVTNKRRDEEEWFIM